MGSLAIASFKAFCKPVSSVAPVISVSRNSASALPSIWRLSVGTTDGSAPTACSFFNNAGVGWPCASSATLTGISFCCTALSAALAATCVMCAAKRRGLA